MPSCGALIRPTPARSTCESPGTGSGVEVMPPPPADVGYVPAGIDFEAARAAVVPIAERVVANIMAA